MFSAFIFTIFNFVNTKVFKTNALFFFVKITQNHDEQARSHVGLITYKFTVYIGSTKHPEVHNHTTSNYIYTMRYTYSNSSTLRRAPSSVFSLVESALLLPENRMYFKLILTLIPYGKERYCSRDIMKIQGFTTNINNSLLPDKCL